MAHFVRGRDGAGDERVLRGVLRVHLPASWLLFQRALPRCEREFLVHQPRAVTLRAHPPVHCARARVMAAGTVVLVCAVLAGCLSSSETSYYDAAFHFHLPVPIGWRANGYAVYYRAGDNCGHEVDLIPPVSEATYRQSPPGDGGVEVIRLFIPIACPGWSPLDQPQVAAHARTITISGKSATLYDGSLDGPAVDRMAVAHFGGHEYDFGFHYEVTSKTPSDQGEAQLALFMSELRGFTYTGG